jgi:ABC-type amino acid transport substrate-binding protein
VRVVQVPFAQIVSGDLGGADLALSQLTPTKKRERRLDFSTAYLGSPPGVLARGSVDASDVKGLRDLQWVISRVSTLTPVIESRIRPYLVPIETVDRTQALKVLRSGRADALMLDLPVALGLAHDDAAHLHVLGQLDGEEELAAALPKGSPNLEIVDSELRHLEVDGTIADLTKKWLGTTDQVPLILTEST